MLQASFTLEFLWFYIKKIYPNKPNVNDHTAFAAYTERTMHAPVWFCKRTFNLYDFLYLLKKYIFLKEPSDSCYSDCRFNFWHLDILHVQAWPKVPDKNPTNKITCNLIGFLPSLKIKLETKSSKSVN